MQGFIQRGSEDCYDLFQFTEIYKDLKPSLQTASEEILKLLQVHANYEDTYYIF